MVNSVLNKALKVWEFILKTYREELWKLTNLYLILLQNWIRVLLGKNIVESTYEKAGEWRR